MDVKVRKKRCNACRTAIRFQRLAARLFRRSCRKQRLSFDRQTLSPSPHKRRGLFPLPAANSNPAAAISGGSPQRLCPWYDSPGSLATETGQWSEALPLNSGETSENEHTLAGCPSDRVLTKALGEQSLGTAEKINRTLSGNSLLLTLDDPELCTGYIQVIDRLTGLYDKDL